MIGEEYLRIGRITGVHGLHGRLKVYEITDVPERFARGRSIYLSKGTSYIPFVIEQSQPYKGRIILLKLEGIGSPEEALAVKGGELFILKSDAESDRPNLEEDSFYYYDLLGCDVYWKGALFGNVIDIMEAGSGEILVIKTPDGKDVYVPFVESMVDTGSIDLKRIEIHPVDGLFDTF